MIHISIFGSYNKQSIGDKAILISLLNLLFECASDSIFVTILCFDPKAIEYELQQYVWVNQVRVISTTTTKTSQQVGEASTSSKIYGLIAGVKRYLPLMLKNQVRKWNNIWRYAMSMQRGMGKESDGLIIGGGNLLMDLFPNWPIRPFLIQREFNKANRPVVIAGVGAFPIKTIFGRILLKYVVQNAQKIYVRDNRTRAYIQKKWRKDVLWCPDFAFSFPLERNKKITTCNFICVNVAPIFGATWPYQDPEKYVFFVASIVNGLYCYYQWMGGDVIFNFFDTNYPTDRSGNIAVIEKLINKGIPREKILYDDRLLSSSEVAQKMVGAEFALVTRLHAAILALRSMTPVLSIAYQPKVRDVLNAVGCLPCVIEVQDLNDLLNRIKILMKNRENFRLNKDALESLDTLNRKSVREILDVFV